MPSLFHRLGGQVALDSVVETFYRKVLSDSRINQFFEDTEMEEQIAKQKSFLSMVFGGPANYTGLDMRESHHKLRKKGLNDSHVNVVIELLSSSLSEHGATDIDIEEVIKITNSARDNVLGR